MSEYKIQNIKLIEDQMEKYELDEPTLIRYIEQYMKYRASLKKAKDKYAKSKKGVLKTRYFSKKHYWTVKVKRYHELYNPNLELKAQEDKAAAESENLIE